MKKAGIVILFFSICYISVTGRIFAYWEWTPETGKWINPKYYVGETSAEQWQLAIEAYEAGNYETALREFNKVLEHFPSSEEAPEAQFMVGDCYEKLGSPYEACQSYQEVIDKYPSTGKLKEIVKRQKNIADYFYSYKHTDMSIAEKAKGIFTISNWEKAANIYQMVVKNYPYYEKADEVQYRIGDCYMQMEKYEIARAEFAKISSQYPDSDWLDDAEYQKAICWMNESERFPNSEQIFEKAIKSFKDFIDRYRDSEFIDEAKEKLSQLNNRKSQRIYEIALFYEKSQDFNSAKIYHQQIIEQFPDSVWAILSRYRINTMQENGD